MQNLLIFLALVLLSNFYSCEGQNNCDKQQLAKIHMKNHDCRQKILQKYSAGQSSPKSEGQDGFRRLDWKKAIFDTSLTSCDLLMDVALNCVVLYKPCFSREDYTYELALQIKTLSFSFPDFYDSPVEDSSCDIFEKLGLNETSMFRKECNLTQMADFTMQMDSCILNHTLKIKSMMNETSPVDDICDEVKYVLYNCTKAMKFCSFKDVIDKEAELFDVFQMILKDQREINVAHSLKSVNNTGNNDLSKCSVLHNDCSAFIPSRILLILLVLTACFSI